MASLQKSIFTQPPKVVTYQTKKDRICYGPMVSYETYEEKNMLEHKTVTRGRKIDMLNSFTI